MQLGELIQFTQYASMRYGPLGWLNFFPRALTEAVTSAERIFEILDEEPAIKSEPKILTESIKGKISFNNMNFGYKSYDSILKNINLEVEPGEMIGLVGHSGAGKSTLINLIMRLYDVDEGSILIHGNDTKIGENGHKLSGGERQRIEIARDILHDPKILILDEATASVDIETEYQIQEALGRIIKNRTTFAIAHRLSTLRNATRLVVIDKGEQIETGSHEELMKIRGKYYKLVMAQKEMSKIKAQ